MKRLWSRLLCRVNNVRIRNKLLMLYLLCVVIPIVVVNLIFYLNVSQNVMNREMNNLSLSMDRIRISFSTDVEQCIQVCDLINIDRSLNQDLDKNYPGTSDYVDEYKSFLENEVGKFIIAYSHISNITVYAANDTIISGGNFAVLTDDIRQGKAYRALFSQGSTQPMLLVTGASSPDYAVSLVSRCNYYNSTVQKMIKIDLNNSVLSWIALSENIGGNVYLLDDRNNCVLQYVKNQSIQVGNLSGIKTSGQLGSNIVVIKDFGTSGIMNGWRLVGVFSNAGVASSMRASGGEVLLLAAGLFALSTLILLIISGSIQGRLKIVSSYLNSPRAAEHLLLDIEPGRDEIGNLIDALNTGAERTRHLINVVYAGEVEKARAELFALQSQIHPHFLYNTLNTIRLKCMLKGEAQTAAVIKRLALLFRRTMSWQEEFITVEEEVAFIVDFLEIQKYRYEDKLTYRIDVEKEALRQRIPKMLLQPLVENASFHGIEMSERNGVIDVVIRIRDSALYCIVKDNGVGIPEAKLKNIKRIVSGETGDPEESIGIYNVYKRLKFYYDSRMNLSVISRPGRGTTIVIKIALETPL